MITCVGAKQVVCIQDVLEISRWDVIELSRPDMEKIICMVLVFM